MENKQLSLEDKVKPYLILANAFKYQILGLKKNNSNDFERIERLNLLKDLVLNQMLNQITRKELVQNYFFLEGFPFENYKEEIEELDKVESLPMSKLVEIMKLNSLSEIKEQLDKVEKDLNNKN